MIEEVLPHVYRMEIPLPRNPLRSINSYLIKGQGRFLIIDTGMNREECMSEMTSDLKKLNVDLHKTDFFITHLHADHLGLVSNLATDTSKVYISKLEASIVAMIGEERWKNFGSIYKAHGFSDDELGKIMKALPGRQYSLKHSIKFNTVKEDDVIDIGDYSFRCIETPGHSPCHMCLYEADKKILVSGDHILSKITPNITFWPEIDNPLKEYLASLDKVYPLDVNLVLPGHRHIFSDHKKRITELKKHHQDRLSEVLSALKDGEKNAFQVAPYIKWDIKYSSWELFPSMQKWFAVGETIAHIKYLEGKNLVRQRTKNQQIVFSAI
ncbi:MAG: MBL fold metallo-hydrolase [Dehalococcoidia bacterium]|nr:MBL fold metallo-hydrolase [Dehalococcoidia bacterium]